MSNNHEMHFIPFVQALKCNQTCDIYLVPTGYFDICQFSQESGVVRRARV